MTIVPDTIVSHLPWSTNSLIDMLAYVRNISYKSWLSFMFVTALGYTRKHKSVKPMSMKFVNKLHLLSGMDQSVQKTEKSIGKSKMCKNLIIANSNRVKNSATSTRRTTQTFSALIIRLINRVPEGS